MKRIRGMSSYADSMEAVNYGNVDDSMLMVGDPIVYNNKGSYVLANIMHIKVGNKKTKSLDLSATDLSSTQNTEFIVKDISTEEIEGRIYWNGQYKNAERSVDANLCLPIHPQIQLDPPPGMSKFFFDGQLIRDIGVDFTLTHAAESTSRSNASSSSSSSTATALNRKCFHCRLNIPLERMREHVAHHIVKGDLQKSHSLCGFCGRDGLCELQIKWTSRSGSSNYFNIQDCSCPYYYAYGKKKAFSKSNHTCNRLLACEVKDCKSVVWAYNTAQHYEAKHPNAEVPQTAISADEIAFLTKHKY